MGVSPSRAKPGRAAGQQAWVSTDAWRAGSGPAAPTASSSGLSAPTGTPAVPAVELELVSDTM